MAKFKELFADKKQTKKYIKLGIAGAVVLLLAVMPMLASGNSEEDGSQASILAAVVAKKDIATEIIGGGQLSSEASLSVKIPENVKLTQYLVGNGDTVQEGDAIAKVDKVSVMTAITQVQDTLDYLSDEITDVSDDEASDTVKASAGGTVKVIYAEEGESVEDVMLDHGALAVLSLDDLMAVQIERQTSLEAGATVCVTLSGGEEVDGRVKANTNGILTITVEDEDYAIGTKVSVTTEDGDKLGSGVLYIYNAWNATAYSGSVDSILVSEGDSVSVGRSLMTLDDPGHTSEYQRLIDQHQEYEELMQELFTMYRTETVTAPCDGIVSGVDEDGAWLLSEDGEGWFASFLSFFGKKNDGFVAYAAQVAEVAENGMKLKVAPNEITVSDVASLSALAVSTEQMVTDWEYSGDTTVYAQGEDGLLHTAGEAKAGDILLAVGDEDQVQWFVRVNGQGAVQTETVGSGYHAVMLSDTEEGTPATDIVLALSNDTGTAKELFSGTLSATYDNDVVAGTWYIQSSSFSLGISGSVLSGVPTTPGTHTVTVVFIPNEESGFSGSVSATFTMTIYKPYEITTTSIPDGTVGVPYNFTMTVSGSSSGQWTYVNLPAGLVLNMETGEISGTPEMAGNFEVTITYTGVGKDQLTSIYNVKISAAQVPGGEGGMPDMGGMSGGMPSGGSMPSGGGSMSGMTGFVVEEDDNLYSLEELTIASVTSQEHMSLSVTIDELDITKIYVGQDACVTVDALGGEQFEAAVTEISNSGENDGGNSKFTVEVTLAKSGDMLPGMYSTAVITLETGEEVPSIPVAALYKSGTDTIVYTSYNKEDGILGDPVVVTIGNSDGENVEIVAGLYSGVVCYYEYYDTYIDLDAPSPGGFSRGR